MHFVRKSTSWHDRRRPPTFVFRSPQLGIRWSSRQFPELLTRHMLFEGLYQEDVIAAIQALARPGRTVFDVGGHHGLMAIVSARAVGSHGKVVTFEPNPQSCKILQDNCRLNCIDNIRIEPVALSDREGETRFFAQQGDVTWNSSIIREFATQAGRDEVVEFTVPLTALDAYVQCTHMVPNVLKIDAEGAEIMILRGAQKTIEQHRPALVMEFNPESAQAAGVRISDIVRWLQDLGYSLTVLRPNPFWRYSFHCREEFSEQLHCVDALCNVVCEAGGNSTPTLGPTATSN